ncbi:MAG: rod shape-determining protein MreD [Sphingomonas sp.]|uniref:rod shape-determining protein MreD n=1 Tax=Sphingomonas sp. TaxID=28214 RepID=UPI000DB1932A|nr:rod shape-determining protein MreD [Sphingomonas sp.]PZP06795.1 MAG: rod shape-determining protein MreD [Sphingomonas hengshuiensis]
MPPQRGPFDPLPLPLGARLVPAISIVAASLLTLWPVIVEFPMLPPIGLMMLLGWRLLQPDALPIWAPLPLGLVDDLLSGQPFGSAMLFWTISFIAIDSIDQRLIARDFWQDWLLASAAIGSYLLFSRLIATRLDAHVDMILLVQIIVSIMLYPVIAQFVGALNRRRAAL